MVYRVVYMLVFLILILSHLGCAQPTSPEGSVPRSGSGWQGPDAQSPTMVIHHLASVDLTDPDNIEKYAKADMVILDIIQLWSPLNNRGAVDALKSVNPDIKVIGYISAHSCWLHWGDDPDNEEKRVTVGINYRPNETFVYKVEWQGNDQDGAQNRYHDNL